MKVKIKFEQPPGHDPESNFDSVVFTTVTASSYEEWGWAVWDFVKSSGTMWDHAKVIQHAFLIDGCHSDTDWDEFVAGLHIVHRKYLLKALRDAGVEVTE